MERDEFEIVEESNLLAELGQRYLPYWPIFMVLVVISITSGYFFIKYSTPVYETSAKLLVKDDKKGVDASKVLDALDVFGEKKIVENEIDILKSWPIMETVVKKLGLYATVYHKGDIRDVELYGNSLPVTFKAVNEDSIKAYKGMKPTEFTFDALNKYIEINKVKYFNNDTLKLGNNYFIVKINNNFVQKDKNEIYYLNFNSVLKISKSLSNGLVIEASSKQSTVINISIKDAVPEKSEDILNNLIFEYQQAALLDKNKVASNTLSFIDNRLKVVLTDLDNVETNIKDYRTREGVINLGAQSEIFLKTVEDNDKQLNTIDLQLLVLKDIENYVVNKGNATGTVPSLIGISDPILSQLLAKLYDAETTLNQQLKISGEKSSLVVGLQQQILKIKVDLLESIKNIRTTFITSKNDLKLNLANANKILKNVPEKEKQLVQISREQAIKNNIYTFLLQKREETAISYMSSVSDSRVVESATTASSPLSPKTNMIYLIAFALGMGVAIIYVIIIDQLNNKILFRNELEQKTGVPVIGELMQGEISESSLAIQEGKRTMLAEQIRTIRTNMAYFGLKENQKVILINSTISGEGKSFVAINLAVSYTLVGKKVAILELDLRKPKISKELLGKNYTGITNYLSGNANIQDLIHPVANIPGLYVIPAGPVPPNPSELISLKAFGELIASLKQQFDYLIIDSPPISLVTDAQLLVPYADIVMFVVRHNYTPKVYLALIAQLQMQKKYPNMCILFNGVKPRGVKF